MLTRGVSAISHGHAASGAASAKVSAPIRQMATSPFAWSKIRVSPVPELVFGLCPTLWRAKALPSREADRF